MNKSNAANPAAILVKNFVKWAVLALVMGSLGGLLGLDPGFAAALGLVGLFCCATNSPVASILVSVEMFGAGNLYVFAFVIAICFVLSGNTGLYASQIIQFDKAVGFDSRLEQED